MAQQTYEKAFDAGDGQSVVVRVDQGDEYGGMPGVEIFSREEGGDSVRIPHEHEWLKVRADVLNMLDAVMLPK